MSNVTRISLFGLLLVSALTPAVAGPPAVHAAAITVGPITTERGKDFGATTDKYVALWNTYRRGDRFDATVKFTISEGWSLQRAHMEFIVYGPPGFTVRHGTGDCDLAPPEGNCLSNGTISYVRYDGVSPVIEVKWKRPAATDVRVGRYRLFASVTGVTLKKGAEESHLCASGCDTDRSPFFVIFNPFENSGDTHVTGLTNAKLARYLADDDYVYQRPGPIDVWHGSPDDEYSRMGGPAHKTLRPAESGVFLTVMNWVDPLGTASARAAVDEITEKTSAFVTGDWGAGAATRIKRGNNVPDIVHEVNTGHAVCGQCFTFASLLGAFTRSVGVPNTIITTMPDRSGPGEYWNFHAWNEVWLRELNCSDGWCAHDATPGQVEKPKDRRDPAFKSRFTKEGRAEPRAFSTLEDGSRTEVTGRYNPHPLGVFASSENVTVSSPSPVVPFGEDIVLSATFRNPLPSELATTLNFEVTLDFLADDLVMRSDNVVFSATEAATIPAGGQVTRTYTVPPPAYVFNGRFAARASMTVGAEEQANHARLSVAGGLALHTSGPASFTPGQPTKVDITVRNLLDTPASGIRVWAHVPPYMHPDQTEFLVNLGANAGTTVSLNLTPVDSLNEAIDVEASSPAAGLALHGIALGLPPGTERVWGDNNCGATADSVDALGDLRNVAAASPLPQTEPCPDIGTIVDVAEASLQIWGDVDCSGTLDSVDALKLLRFVAALPVSQQEPCPDIGTEVLVSEG